MGQLYLISGDDEFNIRETSNALLRNLCGYPPEDNPNLEIFHGDAGDSQLAEVIQSLMISLNTPAFLAESKILWLKRFPFNTTNAKGKAALKDLADLLKEGIADDTTLVLDGIGISKSSKLYKISTTTGKTKIFEKVTPGKREWEELIRSKIRSNAQKSNLGIEPDAVLFLAASLGTESGRITSEINKLEAYIYPQKIITIDACRAVCSMTPETAGWDLANALGAKNLRNALKVLNTLFEENDKGLGILYKVIGHFQDIVKIKHAAAKLGIPRNDRHTFFSKVGNIHPAMKEELKNHIIIKYSSYRAWKIFETGNRFSDNHLSEILTNLIKVNRQLVSGGCAPRIALEALAVKICEKNR